MATLATQNVTSSGLNPTPNVAAVGGDKVRPGSILRVINGSASSITVTLVTPQTVDGDLAVADRPIPVPAGQFRLIAATEVYRNKADNLVSITYSDVTSLTVEVIK